MKGLISVIVVLGMAHLLALLGVAGWLVASERVDAARLERIREVLREPIPVEAVRLEELAKQEEAQKAEDEDKPKADGVPLSAAAALQMHLQEQDLHNERIARLQREVNDLSSLLTLMRTQLDRERTAFEAERAAFMRTREQIEQTEGQEQFRKALGLLAGLKADQAKILLTQLIQDGTFQGDFADALGEVTPNTAVVSGIDQAVAYLDAMPSRQSSKILDAFIEDDPALANELLERLRTRGQVALGTES
jgi:anti-sigma28 factor (negative regulator of flagellin synthesis)